jgi:hypothetical protein
VTGFSGDAVAGDDKAGKKGGEFAADCTKGVVDGVAWGGFVVAAGKKVVAVGVNGAVAEAAACMGKEVRDNGEAEAAEEALVVARRQKSIVGIKAGEIVEGRCHHGVGK